MPDSKHAPATVAQAQPSDEIERRTGIAIRTYFGTEHAGDEAWYNMRRVVRALARDDAFRGDSS
jgi:hypothetical protein